MVDDRIGVGGEHEVVDDRIGVGGEHEVASTSSIQRLPDVIEVEAVPGEGAIAQAAKLELRGLALLRGRCT
jgi:hypothetical protein